MFLYRCSAIVVLTLSAVASRALVPVLFEVNIQADHRSWLSVLDSRTYAAASGSGNWSIDFDCVSPVHPHFDGQITSVGVFADATLSFSSRTEFLWNPPGFNLGWPWLKTVYTIAMWTTAPEGAAVSIHSRTAGIQVNQNQSTSFEPSWQWIVGGYGYQAPNNRNMTFDESHVESAFVTGITQVFDGVIYRKISATAGGRSGVEQNSSNSGGPHYSLIDVSTTLSVSVVPEPSTTALFGAGLLMLVRTRLVRRIRKR